MANIDNVQLPDGSSYNIVDNTSGFATQNYVDSAVSSITKTTIGLGNVDNTSDLNKPISTATQAALNDITDELDKTFILSNQTLTFSNLVATITDARVTASTYAMVYFNNATLQAAANAGVVVDTSTGTITFTASSVPSTSLVCDIVCRKG